MTNEVYEWIVDCVYDYFDFKGKNFISEEYDLKISIISSTVSEYFIRLTHKDKIIVLNGFESLSRKKMAKLIYDSVQKDFKEKETNMTKEVYEWISKCVYMLDGTYKREFINEKFDIKLEIYTHALTADGFDYWMSVGNKTSKAYLDNKCNTAEDLIESIYSSYITDFLTYDVLLKDPLLYVGHLNNRVHTLMNKTADKDNEISKLKDKIAHLLDTVSDMKKINKSLILKCKVLEKELQEEKYAHTNTRNRAIFATHILNGNRENATKEFVNEYEKEILSLINENSYLKKDIEDYRKSVKSWREKYNNK